MDAKFRPGPKDRALVSIVDRGVLLYPGELPGDLWIETGFCAEGSDGFDGEK
jgi:hypothetical protein